MPRKARIDFPGALNHIIFRGIEKKPIFNDRKDYQAMIDRLEECLIESNTACYAWAMMPNHVHLLLETKEKPLSRIMQSLLTSYALYFNKRYKRVGHLFQNRFQSILCDRKDYFLDLIRYVHLSPLREGVINNLEALENFPWCGHNIMLGKHHYAWQNTKEVLMTFDLIKEKAIMKYDQFIKNGIKNIVFEVEKSGFIQNQKGLWKIKSERILGDSHFVKEILEYTKEKLENKPKIDFETIIKKILRKTSISRKDLFSGQRGHMLTQARSLICRQSVELLRMKQAELARRLQLSKTTVSRYLK